MPEKGFRSPAWMSLPARKLCELCGTTHYPGRSAVYWKKQKFCSRRCATLALRRPSPKSKACEHCAATFAWPEGMPPAQWRRRKVCSLECARAVSREKKSKGHVSVVCEGGCGVAFLVPRGVHSRRPRRFCSYRCSVNVRWVARSSFVCKGCGVSCEQKRFEKREFCSARCQRLRIDVHGVWLTSFELADALGIDVRTLHSRLHRKGSWTVSRRSPSMCCESQ